MIPEALRDEYPWKGKWLHTQHGHRLHYLDEGRGEPLLMVHGNPTWSFYWRNLVKGLSDTYRCVVPDHLGCGLSDKPTDWPYRLEGHIDNLVHLVDALDLHDVTLVVHDWGGPIGFGTALKLPDRFKRLVVFNTGCFDGPLPLSIKACRWPVIGPAMVRGLNGFVRVGLMQAIADRSKLRGPVREGYLLPWRSYADRLAVQRFVEDIPLEPDHPSRGLFFAIDAGLASLTDRPTMIAWGEQDFCFTTAYRDEWIRRFPNAEVHSWPDASHWVVEDAHARIVPLLRDWLARHPLDAGANGEPA